MSPTDLDTTLTRAAFDLRASWLTPLLVLLSAWPVKGPLLAGLAALEPGTPRRRLRLMAVVGIAALLGSLASTLVKLFVGRARPPSALGWEPLVALPDTASFPSGHATTAAAAAIALALIAPRWRVVALAIALLVGASRVLLGVHFIADVLAGFLLGALIGVVVGLVGRRLERRRLDRAPSPG